LVIRKSFSPKTGRDLVVLLLKSNSTPALHVANRADHLECLAAPNDNPFPNVEKLENAPDVFQLSLFDTVRVTRLF